MNIGVDIEAVDRFKKFTNKKNIFLQKVFTALELDYCFKQAAPEEHLAARFCGKEAVLKALGAWPGPYPSWKDIKIINQSSGTPCVKIKNKAGHDLKIVISLAHTKSLAVAFVLIYEA